MNTKIPNLRKFACIIYRINEIARLDSLNWQDSYMIDSEISLHKQAIIRITQQGKYAKKDNIKKYWVILFTTGSTITLIMIHHKYR